MLSARWLFGGAALKNYIVKEETWRRCDGSMYVFRKIVSTDNEVVGVGKIEINICNAVKEITNGR
jgi:hypothetical protein